MRTRRELWRKPVAGAAAGLMMAALLTLASATAQAQETMAKPMGSIPAGETYAVIPLKNINTNQDGSDAVTALRNVLSRAHVYYVYTQQAVAIRGTQEDIEIARTMLAALDKPHQSYRLTYTITEKDGGKTVSTRRFKLALDARGKAEMKQGSRIPIETGTSDAQSGTKSQVQYLDLGMKITAALDGARLRSEVEESKLGGSKSAMGVADPVIEQTVLNGETPLALGKPLTLGTLDLPDSTRQEVVEVTAEPVD